MIKISKSNLIIKVGGDETINKIQSELEKHNQFIPIGPFDFDYQISEIVNHNLIGKFVDNFGQIKDWVLNIELNTNSNTMHLGADVVKNVSGYNLSRLIVGGLGEFGEIKSVTIRTLPIQKKTNVSGQILDGYRIVCLLENLEEIEKLLEDSNSQFIIYRSIGVVDISKDIDSNLILKKYILNNGIPIKMETEKNLNHKIIEGIKSHF